jgi:hypothetical protein
MPARRLLLVISVLAVVGAASIGTTAWLVSTSPRGPCNCPTGGLAFALGSPTERESPGSSTSNATAAFLVEQASGALIIGEFSYEIVSAGGTPVTAGSFAVPGSTAESVSLTLATSSGTAIATYSLSAKFWGEFGSGFTNGTPLAPGMILTLLVSDTGSSMTETPPLFGHGLQLTATWTGGSSGTLEAPIP